MFRADCYSCARCLNVCPSDAISYGLVFGQSSTRRVQEHDIVGTSSENLAAKLFDKEFG